MGFYFRKSINFGLFRLNFSKSGIGMSAGVKGARVSKTPKGAYVHFGSNGFYYKQRIDTSNKQTNKSDFDSKNSSTSSQQKTSPENSTETIHYIDTSNAELLNKINSTIHQPYSSLIIQISTMAFSVIAICVLINALVVNIPISDPITLQVVILSELFIFITLFSITLFLSWKAYQDDRRKRTTPLFYQLWGISLTRFTNIKKACEILSKSSSIWRLRTFSNDMNQPLDVLKEQPPYILTDVDVWSLDSNRISLYFLPDYIFVWNEKKYGVVSYESIDVFFSTDTILSRGKIPKDATIARYVYQHTRKDGLPDRRYKYNPAFPIIEYGLIEIKSKKGWSIILQVSNLSAARNFADIFNQEVLNKQDKRKTTKDSHKQTNNYQNNNQNYQRQSSNKNQSTYTTPNVTESVRLAHEVLEIRVGATREQIIAAYREQVKSYHPDKAAQASPKIVKLAEEKTKQINAAYETLKKHNYV